MREVVKVEFTFQEYVNERAFIAAFLQQIAEFEQQPEEHTIRALAEHMNKFFNTVRRIQFPMNHNILFVFSNKKDCDNADSVL